MVNTDVCTTPTVHRRKSKIAAWLTCFFKGHRYNTAAFHSNCLYFCTCCDRELLGRTFEDIEPLSDDERELIDMYDRAMEVSDVR